MLSMVRIVIVFIIVEMKYDRGLWCFLFFRVVLIIYVLCVFDWFWILYMNYSDLMFDFFFLSLNDFIYIEIG